MRENPIKKTKKDIWPIPAAVVAHVAGTSQNNVNKIRRGARGSRSSNITRRVLAADAYLREHTSKLLEAVRKAIAF